MKLLDCCVGDSDDAGAHTGGRRVSSKGWPLTSHSPSPLGVDIEGPSVADLGLPRYFSGHCHI
jgi:hypothetical protein